MNRTNIIVVQGNYTHENYVSLKDLLGEVAVEEYGLNDSVMGTLTSKDVEAEPYLKQNIKIINFEKLPSLLNETHRTSVIELEETIVPNDPDANINLGPLLNSRISSELIKHTQLNALDNETVVLFLPVIPTIAVFIANEIVCKSVTGQYFKSPLMEGRK